MHSNSIIHQFNLNECRSDVRKTSFYISAQNKGYQMLRTLGWNSESGLGPTGEGIKYPVRTKLKLDRAGLGSKVTAETTECLKNVIKKSPQQRSLGKSKVRYELSEAKEREQSIKRAIYEA